MEPAQDRVVSVNCAFLLRAFIATTSRRVYGAPYFPVACQPRLAPKKTHTAVEITHSESLVYIVTSDKICNRRQGDESCHAPKYNPTKLEHYASVSCGAAGSSTAATTGASGASPSSSPFTLIMPFSMYPMVFDKRSSSSAAYLFFGRCRLSQELRKAIITNVE